MDVFEAIHTRRSIRRFTQAPVDDAVVERLLRAATSAPSAGDQRPWRFVVLRDEAARVAVASASPYAKMLPGAAVGIVVCAQTEGLTFPHHWPHDCAAAVQNILLAARALGLGAVWLGYHPDADRVAGARAALGLPDDIAPFAVVAIGHPGEEKPPVDRFDPDHVHVDRW